MSGSSAPPSALVRPGVSLLVIVVISAVTQAMVILDGTIVNVALPSMREDLGLSTVQVQWVVDGFLVTLGGFLLLASRASDLFGRKEVFQIGIVVFTLASLAGGLAEDGTLLIAARIAQGLGAAALAPSSLSLITATHHDEKRRAKALSIWAGAGGAAGALGIVLGGVLTSGLSWRWVMFVNVPIGVALFAAAAWSLRPAGRRPEWRRLDLPGTVCVTGGVTALVYGLSQATAEGWRSAGVAGPLVAAVVLLVAFAVVETRSREPLVPLSIFRRGRLSAANGIMACVGAVITASGFLLSLYLQQVAGYSPVRTGLALLPFGVGLIAGAVLAERLGPSAGPRLLLLVGGLITTAGFGWQAHLPVDVSFGADVLGPTVVLGLGIGICVVPVADGATAAIEPELAGLASGLINTARQLGGAVGVAVVVTLAASEARDVGERSAVEAVVHGYNVALLACAGVSLLGTLLALFMPRPARATADR